MTGCPEAADAAAEADAAAQAGAHDVPYARVVPFSHMEGPHDMKTRDGDYIRVFELQGMPFETAMPYAVESRHTTLCNYIGTQSALADCMFYVSHFQTFTSDRLDPVTDGTYATVFDRNLHADLNSRPALRDRLYISIVVRMPRLLGRLTDERLARNRADCREVMEQRSGALLRALRDFKPRLLGERTNEHGRTFSEVAEFAGMLVNGRWTPVRAGDGPLYRRLPRVRKSAQAGVVELAGSDGIRYAAMLDIQDYGEGEVEPGWLNMLLYERGAEFIETHSFQPYTMRKSLSVLEMQRRQLTATNDAAAESQGDEMTQARTQIRAGHLRYGRYSYSLAMFADTPEAALRAAEQVRSSVAEISGFNLVLCDLLADNAWLAQMPGNQRRRTRRADISHRAFCALASCHGFYTGKRDGNPWGQALAVLRARSGRNVYLNLHASPMYENNEGEKYPGATVILGVNGSGKTTLEAAALLLSRHWSPAPAAVVLDKDQGLEIAVRAVRGTYVQFQMGVPTGLCPFQWPVTKAHAIAQVEILKAMTHNEKLPLLPSELLDLETAVAANDRMEPSLRGVLAIWQRLPPDGPYGKELSLKKRLERWTAGQPLGWVFDEAPDTLPHGTGGVCGFDYTDFLKLPEIRRPVSMALLQFAEDRIDGNRVMLIVAEAWKAIEDPVIGNFTRDKSKTIRKQNGILIFDTQEPDDLAGENVGDTIISQAATIICFPDEVATEKAYIDRLGLTPAELQIVRTLRQHGRRCFLFKQGNTSAVLEFDLSRMEEAIWVLSGSLDNVHLLSEIRAELGDDPDDFLPVLFARIRERNDRNRSLAAASRAQAAATL